MASDNENNIICYLQVIFNVGPYIVTVEWV